MSNPTLWYQIMPDKFAYAGMDTNIPPHWNDPPADAIKHGGTFYGIIEKIENGYFDWITDHKTNWGIYLTPVYANPASYHKYWPDDHHRIEPEFGGLDGLRKLVQTINGKNGRIMVDLVFNHTGITHYFFNDILGNGPSSPYYKFYRKLPNPAREKIQIPILTSSHNAADQCRISKDSTLIIQNRFSFPGLGNRVERRSHSIEGEFFRFVDTREPANYGCWWDLPMLPELNTSNVDVKSYLFQSVSVYLELGIRHFRIDVPDALSGAKIFWKEFRNFIKAHVAQTDDSEFYIVGEIWKKEKYAEWIPSSNKQTAVFDGVMNYSFRRAVVRFLSDKNVSEEFGKVIRNGGWNAQQARAHFADAWGRFDQSVLRDQLNLLGSHDVDRVGDLIDTTQNIKTAYVVLFTFPGVPSLYYGDELGMNGARNKDIDGARESIKWASLQKKGNGTEELLTGFLSALIKRRQTHPELIFGDFQWVGDHPGILAYQRVFKNNKTIIIAAPEKIDNLVLYNWIQKQSDTRECFLHIPEIDKKLTDLTIDEIGRVRKYMGALIASGISSKL